MGLFRRKEKEEAFRSVLLQLNRIADSLEVLLPKISEEPEDHSQEHLNRIADSLEHINQTEQNKDVQASLDQLGRIAKALESVKTEDQLQQQHLLVTQMTKMTEALENNYRKKPDEVTIAQLVQLTKIADALEKATTDQRERIGEQQKLRAAYALNLCLVSISQIIDYSDLYILEQEYDGILNNLNLENMPKDEALLDILRQILDTITFFRIQEGEKQFVEKDYQDRMKTAIWSAVPNCAVIFSHPSPKAMLFSLVTQVGTGYMNYRKEKAQALRDKEKSMWELQKAAIEQFNGLRRELFTTAWRLADAYGFDDKLRLTENQISQYNRILMDENLDRRLLRLEDLEDKFLAYPPYWFQRGHTALLLAEKNPNETDHYCEKARGAFELYFAINTKENELLRTDYLCANCALEYVSLLKDSEESEKLKYIKRAIESAGSNFDILQMCAVAYLDMKKVDEAAKVLRMLVCEGYNTGVNAQLLSTIYIAQYLKDKTQKRYFNQYTELQRVVENHPLVEWPNGDSVDDQYVQFLLNRRSSLLEEYSNFLGVYYGQKARQFERDVLCQEGNREKPFVRFARQLGNELQSFPGVNLTTAFSEMMHAKKGIIDGVVKDKGESGSNKFDEIFKDVFIAAAKSIAQQDLLTMKAISETEIALGSVAGAYYANDAARQLEAPEPECTLDALCAVERNVSDKYKAIKDMVRKANILKESSKWTEVLIAGSTEYYRYIRDHKLDPTRIVAVINDKSVTDCDLLITDRGLMLHQGQSKASRFARGATRIALAVTGNWTAVAAGSIVDTAMEILKAEVPFSDVIFNSRKNKLDKPGYSNKHVNMEKLSSFVKAGATVYEGSMDSKIREIICKDKSVSFSKAKRLYLLDRLDDTQKTDLYKAIVAVAIYYGRWVGDVSERKRFVMETTKNEIFKMGLLSDADCSQLDEWENRFMQFANILPYLECVAVMYLDICAEKMEEILPSSLDLHPYERKQKAILRAYIEDRKSNS